MKHFCTAIAALFTVWLPASVFAQPFLVGPEYQVNSHSSEELFTYSVALDDVGNFVVAWRSDGSAGSDSASTSIQGRHFQSTGLPSSRQLQINTYTTDRQHGGSVGMDAAGNFVAVWHSEGSSGSDSASFSIQGQRFHSSGAPNGSEFQVNSYTTGHQANASVLVDPTGSFFVAWQSAGSVGSDSSIESIQGQRFDSTGVPVGTQFQINTFTTGSQLAPELASDAAGNLIVIWTNGSIVSPASSSISETRGQRLDSSGTPIGAEFPINISSTRYSDSPRVAADASGNFVVTWRNVDVPSREESVRGLAFDSTGNPVGEEFQVSTDAGEGHLNFGLTADAQGNFFALWTKRRHGREAESIRSRRLDSSGALLGREFQVGSHVNMDQSSPRIAANEAGDLVVVWVSSESGSTPTVRGQRLTTADLCGPVPEDDGDCHIATGRAQRRNSIKIEDETDDTKDRLTWKWSMGTAVEAADFKTPLSSTDTYRVCLYDGGGKLLELDLPAGGTVPQCRGRACWRALGSNGLSGFRYRNASGRGSHGITNLKVKGPNTNNPKLAVTADGKGGSFSAPATSELSDPVTIQMLIDDGGGSLECIKSSFTTSRVRH